jgi:hypothetical protein
MSKFESFLDLKTAALQRAGELTNGNSDYDTIVEEQMNSLLRSIFSGSNEFDVDLGEPWEWAKAEFSGVLTLIPPYATGTVALTQGSSGATLSTAPTGLGSLRGHYLMAQNNTTIYRIVEHTADATGLTLDQIYLEDTAAAATFKIIKLDYELLPQGYFDSSPIRVERLIGPMRCFKANSLDGGTEIEGLDTKAFEKKFPRAVMLGGIPENFTTSFETNGVMTVRFSHYQIEDKLRVEYDYIPVAPHQCLVEFEDSDMALTKSSPNGTFNKTNHGLSEGQPVMLTTAGTLPAGLSIETLYYAYAVDANSFQLKASRTGATTLVPTDVGSADTVHTISTVPPIPHAFRKVLFQAAAHTVMVDKSDSKASYYQGLTVATLKSMVAANRKQKRHTSATRGRLIARPDQIPNSVNRTPKVFD